MNFVRTRIIASMSTYSRKDLIRKLLKGIETGDPEAATVVNEKKYVQHNPHTAEGGEGLAALFARLAKFNPEVNIVRCFEDGDYVFGHTEYDFSKRRIGFEIFRFEGDTAVEHWDNIMTRSDGDGMIEGPTQATDHEFTELNREFVRSFVEEVHIKGRTDLILNYCEENMEQHSLGLGRGTEALVLTSQFKNDDGTDMYVYERIHRVLAEGDFVLISIEGYLKKEHTSFYNLYRVKTDPLDPKTRRIAEQWQTTETIPPKSEWKNNNGKF
eukprot:m.53340 g.53340  ORF g.53340 m.53340 type:complete len:270 (-) comp10860_c0_seq1:1343-2152(-)